MLPAELLRVTVRRGRVTPLFCLPDPGGADMQLAARLVDLFRGAVPPAAGEPAAVPRSSLLSAAAGLEGDHDHRLVRGLFAILERRTEFAGPRSAVDPATARRRLFEESAARGLALTADMRASIVAAAAARAGVTPAEIEDAMWNDSSERATVRRFRPIDAAALAAAYNMSLAQTLLFRCASLEVRLRGGAHWKRVLREVKRRQLMYVLEPARGPDDEPRAEVSSCVIEGSASLFRMTDRYGTAMARVLPAVVSSQGWEVSGKIIRHTDDGGGARLYRFALSEKSHGKLLRGGGAEARIPDRYDSSVEERFAAAFEAHFGRDGIGGDAGGGGAGARPPGRPGADHLGWRLVREPDPLVAGGRAMIPDFAFERFGRRVYMEIVGFWTRDYIKKKSEKISALLQGGEHNAGAGPVDLIVAVNSALTCSQGMLDMGRDCGDAGRVFSYTGSVPLKPVLARLAAIDAEIIREKEAAADVPLDGLDGDLIDAREVAALHGMPVEAAARILARRLPGHVLAAGRYFVSPKRAASAKSAVQSVVDAAIGGGGGRFTDVCAALRGASVPEPCHAGILPAIGYDVVWRDLDPAHARVVRRSPAGGA